MTNINQPILVIGATGKTGSRVAAELEARKKDCSPRFT
jgi:uncharacterized protein YbjT (DUF2867 family)